MPSKGANVGENGFFLRLASGLYNRCFQLMQRFAGFIHAHDVPAARIGAQTQEAQERLNALNAQLADQQALFDAIQRRALDAAAQEREALLESARAEAANDAERTAAALEQSLAEKRAEALALHTRLLDQHKEYDAMEVSLAALAKKNDAAQRKLLRLTDTAKRLQAAIQLLESSTGGAHRFDELLAQAESDIAPTVELKLHCMDVKELRKKFNQNKKLIVEVLEKYQGRYTTKTNAALYQLMTIALEAELQNILYNIGFGKLDDAQAAVTAMCERYIAIASTGNQQIAPTLIKFIGEIRVLYANAVNIEYEYHIKKEQAREEQRAIREKMREEAADRRRLAEEQKKMELEQTKYVNQIDALQTQLSQAAQDDAKSAALQQRIEELQAQLAAVESKKEEIVSRQNGQAGHVYVISNLGSFGEDVFKVGMTRRLDPMERIDELGSASVPFPFDVHSVIFSENAVQLEHDLHEALHSARLNKVNLRKEFFKVTLDDLEEIVYRCDPTAEFNRTMLAEQYRQSLSMDQPAEAYSSESVDEDEAV